MIDLEAYIHIQVAIKKRRHACIDLKVNTIDSDYEPKCIMHYRTDDGTSVPSKSVSVLCDISFFLDLLKRLLSHSVPLAKGVQFNNVTF